MSGVYTFKWSEPGADEVFVTGDFDDWQKTLPLVKQTNGTFLLTAPLELKKDKIQYKYVVDGHWKVDNSARVEHDSAGHVNNVLLISDLYTGDTVPESGLPVNMAAANAQPAHLSASKGSDNLAPEVLPKDPPPNLLGTPGPVLPANASEIKEFREVSTVDPKSLNPEQPTSSATAATTTSDSVSTSSEKKKKKKKSSKDKKKSSDKKKKSSSAATPTSTAATPIPGDTPSTTAAAATPSVVTSVHEAPKLGETPKVPGEESAAPAPISKDKGKETTTAATGETPAPANPDVVESIDFAHKPSAQKALETKEEKEVKDGEKQESTAAATATSKAKEEGEKDTTAPPPAPKKDTAPNTPSKKSVKETAATGEAEGQKQAKKKKGFWNKLKKILS